MSHAQPDHAPAQPARSDGTVVAVLTAAGSGRRLGADLPKALVQVAGQSLLRRSARTLATCGVVDHVVVTAPPDDLPRFISEVMGLRAELGAQGEAGVAEVEVVAGSPASRQASVALGLRAALARHPDCAVVLVHDAARALTPPEVVHRVVAAVRAGSRAVVPVVAVADTLKEVVPGPGGALERVVSTPERSRLRAAQTPQGFEPEVLRRAHEWGHGRAVEESQAASDDAALAEAIGVEVHCVPGDVLAFKVTTALDLALAEVLAGRESH